MRCKFCNSRDTTPIDDKNVEFDFQCNACGQGFVKKSFPKPDSFKDEPSNSISISQPTIRNRMNFAEKLKLALNRVWRNPVFYSENKDQDWLSFLFEDIRLLLTIIGIGLGIGLLIVASRIPVFWRLIFGD